MGLPPSGSLTSSLFSIGAAYSRRRPLGSSMTRNNQLQKIFRRQRLCTQRGRWAATAAFTAVSTSRRGPGRCRCSRDGNSCFSVAGHVHAALQLKVVAQPERAPPGLEGLGLLLLGGRKKDDVGQRLDVHLVVEGHVDQRPDAAAEPEREDRDLAHRPLRVGDQGSGELRHHLFSGHAVRCPWTCSSGPRRKLANPSRGRVPHPASQGVTTLLDVLEVAGHQLVAGRGHDHVTQRARGPPRTVRRTARGSPEALLL